MSNTNTKRNNQTGRTASQRSRQKKNNDQNYGLLLIGGIVVVVLATLIFLINNKKNGPSVKETTTAAIVKETEETIDHSVLQGEHIIDMSGIPGFSQNAKIELRSGMDREDIVKAAHKFYNWDMKIVNEDALVGNVVKPTVDPNETTATGTGDVIEESAESTEEIAALTEITVEKSISVPDIIEKELFELLDTVFADDKAQYSEKKAKTKEKKTESESVDDSENKSIYIMTLEGVPELIDDLVQDADDMWYVEAKGGSIERYDAENDKFIMEGSSDGCAVLKDKLKDDLTDAFNKGTYKCTIPVSTEVLPAESAVKNGDYKIIAVYVTKTTSNSVRNKNIQLACETLNGTIVRPGEEFSYNQTIGQRTEERGFGTAAAYANGEVVQEVGGGVCQLSSTLYNAITEAGLKTTYRSPHTFKPTYVTPGQDATVSWGGPDYRFANIVALPDISYDTTYAIGIKSRYSDQTVTVEIYGRPVLKPGYTITMESEMTGETDVPRILITPEMAEAGKEPTTGDKGSHWKTYLLIQKDGTMVSRDVYHNTSYNGHTEYYLEEPLTEESSSEMESESESTEEYTGPIGPGMPQRTTEAPGPAINSSENSGPENETGSPTPVETIVSPGGEPPATDGGNVPVVDVPGGAPGSETQGALSPGDPGFVIQEGP